MNTSFTTAARADVYPTSRSRKLKLWDRFYEERRRYNKREGERKFQEKRVQSIVGVSEIETTLRVNYG